MIVRRESPGGVDSDIMGLGGCRGEDLKQLHQNGRQESDDHLSLHGMQTLGERDRETQRKNKQMNVSRRVSGTEQQRERQTLEKEAKLRYKILMAVSMLVSTRHDTLQRYNVVKNHAIDR